MLRPPSGGASAAAAGSRPVVLSLFRTMLRWLNQPVVKEVPFHAGELPPELLALGLNRQQLTNREGLRSAISATFRRRAALSDPALVSQALDVGFLGLQYLNGLTGVLERAQERRQQNRNRDGIRFRIGEVVRHRLFSYRGVVLGWDRRPTIDVSGWDGVAETESRENQPFFHVAIDAHDCAHFLGSGAGGMVRRRLMYVAQENLKLEESMLERRVQSDLVASATEMFDPIVGRFVVQEQIAYQYPADVLLDAPSLQHKQHAIMQAKLVDASRRVERQVQLLAKRLSDDIQRHFGVLERFDEPVKGILVQLDRMAATSLPGGRQQQPQQPQHGKHRLEQLLGGYRALGLLKDLFVLSEDLHTSRAGAEEGRGGEAFAFELGQVVRHQQLGWRGVVAGTERFPRIPLASDPAWLQPSHPHYRVIVNEEDRDASSTSPSETVLLPQEELEAAHESAAVSSPLILQVFSHFDPHVARFVPTAATRFKVLGLESPRRDAGPVEAALAGQRRQQWWQEEKVVERVYKVLLKLFDHVRTKQRGAHGHAQGLKGDVLLMLQQAPRKEDADVCEALLWLVFLAHSSKRVRTLMEDGVQLLMRAKYDAAIARFDEALRFDEAFAEGFNKRGTAHFLAGRHPESHADLLRTLALEPAAHFGALIGKGLVEFERGKKVRVIKALRAALRVHPWATSVGTTLHHCRKLLEDEKNADVEG